jgi:hypothetical protein
VRGPIARHRGAWGLARRSVQFRIPPNASLPDAVRGRHMAVHGMCYEAVAAPALHEPRSDRPLGGGPRDDRANSSRMSTAWPVVMSGKQARKTLTRSWPDRTSAMPFTDDLRGASFTKPWARRMRLRTRSGGISRRP